MREGLRVNDCIVYSKAKAEDCLYLFLMFLNPHILLVSDMQSNSNDVDPGRHTSSTTEA